MKFVALYRVSTGKQKDSNLGLEAQQAAVLRYISSVKGELVAEVEEVQSAGNKDHVSVKNQTITYQTLLAKRPMLQQAIELCKQHNATLVVKELSRLTRLSILMDYLITYKVKFVCADSPGDDPMLLKLRTIWNEDELLKISSRTSAALQAKKARGEKLGGTKPFTAAIQQSGVAANRANAANNIANRQAMHVACAAHKQALTLQQIADQLNSLGFKTRRGKAFARTTVNRLLKRCIQD